MSKYKERLEMLKSWAIHDASLYHSLTKTIASFGLRLEESYVLDIGCGVNAPMTIMLHSRGTKVTGIDEYIGYRWGLGFKPSRYVHYHKEVGLLKTLRKVVGEFVYDRHYYSCLEEFLGFPLTEKDIDLRNMQAEKLQFNDDTFDIVYSNATWEHLSSVETANQEIARVLRPGGMAYIEIHLFPSLSGGHDLPWIVPGKTDFGDVLPWSHLRNPGWQAPVYLNRLREQDYYHLFEHVDDLEIIDWMTEFTEGEEFLTSELLEELSDYTREELTKRSIIALLRKREVSGA